MFNSEHLKYLARLYKLDKEENINTAVVLTHFRPEIAEKTEKIILSQVGDKIISPPPFESPDPSEVKGDIIIGWLDGDTNTQVGLTSKEINRNVSIYGAPGTGKTTLNYGMIRNSIRDHVVWVIDKKRDYRHLKREIPDLRVIRWENYRRNPLRPPPGVDPVHWLQCHFTYYCHAFNLLTGSESFLIDHLNQLYNLFGVYRGSDKFPTLKDSEILLREMLTKYSHRGPLTDYIHRNLNRCSGINASIGSVVNCDKGYLDELIRRRENVVFEFDGLGELFSSFLIEDMLFYIYYMRKAKNERGDILRNIIFMDDCTSIFSRAKERNYVSGIPNIDILLEEIREFGVGIVASTQEPSKVSDSLKANSEVKIVFNLHNGEDIGDISRCMMLDSEGMKAITELERGEALIHIAGRTHPFVINIPWYPVEKNLTDEELKRMDREFLKELNSKVVPRSDILEKKLSLGREQGKISKEEEMYLMHILKNPFLTENERKTGLGLTNYMANKIVKNLVMKGFIIKRRFYTGRPGNAPVLQELTQRARNYLKSVGMNIPKGSGKGSIIHQRWQNIIKEFWKGRRMEVLVEPTGNGANADVLVIDPQGKRTAVEIALSKDGQLRNIRRDLEYFDEVILAAETGVLRERIRAEALKELSREEIKRVKFCLLNEFLNGVNSDA